MKNNRKRSNKNIIKPIVEFKSKSWMDDIELPEDITKEYPCPVFTNQEVNMFKELIELSNNVAGLFKQIIDAELNISRTKALVKAIKNKELKPPYMQQVTRTISIPVYDALLVAHRMSEECALLEKATEISKKQLRHRYDEFVDSIKGFKNILDRHLSKVPEKNLAKEIIGCRRNDTQQIEQKVFDKIVEEATKKELEKKIVEPTEKAKEESKKLGITLKTEEQK